MLIDILALIMHDQSESSIECRAPRTSLFDEEILQLDFLKRKQIDELMDCTCWNASNFEAAEILAASTKLVPHLIDTAIIRRRFSEP